MITASKYRPSKLHFNSLKDLKDHHLYVGFQPSNNDTRYMVVTGGLMRVCAVSPTKTWCSIEEHQTDKERYIIFETKEDLLEWMKG